MIRPYQSSQANFLSHAELHSGSQKPPVQLIEKPRSSPVNYNVCSENTTLHLNPVIVCWPQDFHAGAAAAFLLLFYANFPLGFSSFLAAQHCLSLPVRVAMLVLVATSILGYDAAKYGVDLFTEAKHTMIAQNPPRKSPIVPQYDEV